MDVATMNPPSATRVLTDDTRRAPTKPELLEITGRLESEVNSRISKRKSLEDRWITDLEQYHGRYNAQLTADLQNEERSTVFINQTRPKTDDLGARLKDLLFPTDEKNWGIGPTPVPELTEAATKATAEAEKALDAAKAAAAAPEKAQQQGAPQADLDAMAQQGAEQQQKADNLQALASKAQLAAEEGRNRAKLMEREIHDQLTESLYHIIKRDQIDCAMKVGTGVTKGPVTGDVVRRGWKQQPDGTHKLVMSGGDRPAHRGVDIWGFFPDMDVAKVEDGNGVYERHIMNRKRLRDLQFLAGFDQEAIKRLLKMAPQAAAPSYLAELRNIRAATQQVTGDIYQVFEYNGPLEPEDMETLARMSLDRGDTTTSAAAFAQLGEVDVLKSVNACVWFCQGEILKFAVYPYDSGECMYSVFNLVKDEHSIFGYGMPALLRDPQDCLNGAFRAMMDNAGISSGPQIIVDRQNVEPADGDYTLRPRKIWYAKNGIPKENLPFLAVHIETRQAELAAIITICEHFLDILSQVPQVLQGQPGEPGTNQVQTTAMGTAILHNAANVAFRSMVKNFDDDVTVPDIRRTYDWNMQFNPKEEIKGDYQVDARGSSVLLVREMQAQNLLVLAVQLGGHPIYGPMLRNRDLLRKLFQAYMIPAEEVVLTDDEIDIILLRAEQQNEQLAKNNAEKEKQAAADARNRENNETKIAVANANADHNRYEADKRYDAAMNTLAARLNMSVQELEASLADTELKNQSKERIFASEVAVEQRNAEAARARGEEPQSSGGYVAGGASKKKAA